MSSNKKLIIFLIFCILSFCVLNYVLIVYIPSNPIKTRYPFFSSHRTKEITPQGWAFFTKDPRTSRVFLSKVSQAELIAPISLKATQWSSLLGIKRKNRIINSKISKIINNVDPSLWYTKESHKNDSCTIKDVISNLNKIKISVKEPSICGLFLVEVKKPIPWSWLKFKNSIQIESKIILIEFVCI